MKHLLPLLVLLTSCAQPSVDIPKGYSQQEFDDLQYVLSLSGHDENFVYDHADERQHRHFIAQLKQQGLTEENSPGLFASLMDLREHHQTLRPNKMRSSLAYSVSSTEAHTPGPIDFATGTGSSVPVQTISSLAMVDANTATATALSSVPNNAYYSQVSVQLLDGSGPLAKPVMVDQYNGGEDLTANSVAGYTGAGALAAKLTYYYKHTATSTPVTGQSIVSCKDCLITSSCPTFSNIEPIGKTGQDSPITVCIYRSSAGNCTYWYNKPSSHDIVFPVKGSVSFGPKNISVQSGGNKVNGGTASLWITNNVAGGGCKMISSTNFFAAPNTVVSAPNTLSWNFDPADFGQACFTSGESVTFVLSMSVPATDGTQMCAYVSNSTQADTAVFVTYEIGPMNIFYGCLAEGAMVTMADGSEKPIELVEIGEQVLSNASGRSLTVEGTTKGIEPIPSVEIHTSNSKTLMMTQDHPVPTTRGIVLGKELVEGDSLISQDGLTIVLKVVRIQYDGAVWNLHLEDTSDAPITLNEENSTFFANGILVGDSRMQKIHLNKHKSNHGNVRSRLHPSWLKDYETHLERTGKAQ